MTTLSDQLGNRTAGQLIRSDDWNSLVAAVQRIETELNLRIDGLDSRLSGDIAALRTDLSSLDSRVQGLDGRIQQVDAVLAALRGRIEPLLLEHYRVTLQTERINYAVGELAEITAGVTDVEGNPLDLSRQANRPWIDFVSAWGQLKPAPGFTSLGGAGDRTISVQVDGTGVARVRLRAEHAEGFTDEAEDEVSTALTTRLATSGRSVVQAILDARTPMEAKSSGAFKAMTAEYQRRDATSVRSYVDTYYVKSAALVTGRVLPPVMHRWRDSRSTVLAFAKRDSDPSTPDHSRGVSSIQVTFRDWIGPWIALDFVEDVEETVGRFRDRIRQRVTKNFGESLRLIQDDVKSLVAEEGLVGKQRSYRAFREAMASVSLADQPPFFGALSRTVQTAINAQQTMGISQATAIGIPTEETAFEAFAGAAGRADTTAEEVQTIVAAFERQVAAVEKSVQAADRKASSLERSVGGIGGRLDALTAEGGEIQRMRSSVSSVSQLAGALTALNPTEVNNRIGSLEVQLRGLRRP